jgi:hypothetical protein
LQDVLPGGPHGIMLSLRGRAGEALVSVGASLRDDLVAYRPISSPSSIDMRD